MSYFIGQETVYFRDQPVRSMVYSGGVPEEYDLEFTKSIYVFLRKAKRSITVENPFRGPKEFIENYFIYQNNSQGDMDQFTGEECIIFNNKEVYHLSYSGGFIR